MTGPLPPLDPAHMSHLMAVQAAMLPSEGERVREHAASLEPLKLRCWLWDLSRMSVPDAVRALRRSWEVVR